MTDLTITELELTPGLWRPDATISCFECHCKQMGGPVWGWGTPPPMDPERFKEQPLDDAMDSAIGHCNECGKAIWMPYKISWEQKVVAALKERGIKAVMDQTGGMCSAASVYLDSDEGGGQKHIMITESEDVDRPHDDPTFVVGYYHYENPYGDDVEGEDYSILPLNEAVDLVAKIVKEGRLNA
jgi:hypothetical protein